MPDNPPAHKGYDFFGNAGDGVDPVCAAFAGTIVQVLELTVSYGFFVIIRHQTTGTTKYETLYAHLHDFASGIAVGAKVLRGDLIGHKGNTGNADGVHLHFELRRRLNDQTGTLTTQPDSQNIDSTIGCNPGRRSVTVLKECDIPFTDLFVGLAWHLRNSNSSGGANVSFVFGRTNDIPLVADFDGSGTDDTAVFRSPNTWFIDLNRDGATDMSFAYGAAAGGDFPVAGDWNGDGVATRGVVRGNLWLLDDNSDGVPDHTVAFGVAAGTDLPIVGDWNGNGIDTPGVFRSPNGWHLSDDFIGTTTYQFSFGAASGTDLPVVGDWDGCASPLVCAARPGVVRGSTWLLRYALSGGTADVTYGYGRSLDVARAGDWNADRVGTAGLARGQT